jgi:hypothetical protein
MQIVSYMVIVGLSVKTDEKLNKNCRNSEVGKTGKILKKDKAVGPGDLSLSFFVLSDWANCTRVWKRSSSRSEVSDIRF